MKSSRAAVCAALVSIAVPATGAAQLRAGFGGGVSISSLPGLLYPTRFGAVAGPSLTWDIGGVIGFQAEVLLHEKGGADTYSNLRMRYAEFPFLLRVRAGVIARSFRPVFSIGVAPAIEISCGAQQVGENLNHPDGVWPQSALSSAACDQHRTDRGDIGVLVGAGLEMRLTKRWITVGIRSTRGMHNIASDFPRAWGRSVFNRSVTLMVGTR